MQYCNRITYISLRKLIYDKLFINFTDEPNNVYHVRSYVASYVFAIPIGATRDCMLGFCVQYYQCILTQLLLTTVA